MAKFNLDYYKQEDIYSDGDIEDVMLEMAKEGKSYENLPVDKVEFPMIYHFSKIRHNILNWYSFKPNAAVLEIGAGCGALTGMLCEKADHVVAVELSKRRGLINLTRHQDYDNLSIMVGNLNDMQFEEKFDYIVLNGVLEYAASFTEGEKPYVNFLKKMSGFLKADGRLLIAIENRLGLKYFAGAPEDHTDIYYLGLNNYSGNSSVCTFSKQEMRSLLEESGLPFMKYYYPYPDYKFPTEIFTDETLTSNSYGKPYKTLTDKRFNLFEESKVAHDLVAEGIVDCFANSFLVEAGMQELITDTEVLYVKINSERKEKFQIFTSILRKNGNKFVTKKAVSPLSDEFVDSIIASSDLELPEPYKNLPSEGGDGCLLYRFLEGQTMSEIVWKYIKKRDKNLLVNLLQEFYETYFSNRERKDGIYSSSFTEVFGDVKGKNSYECISPANIDLICDNIFICQDKSYIIDYEWVFDFPVPVLFIMWRMINELYSKFPEMEQLIGRSELYSMLHIETEDNDVFLEWGKHFAYVYVGSEALSQYAKPEMTVDLNQIAVEKRYENKLISKLYYDTGKGLNEEECIVQVSDIKNNRFKVSFDLSSVKGVGFIRWDISQGPSWYVIDRIDSDCQMGLMPVGDYFVKDGKTVFLSGNPRFVVDTFTPEKIGCLKIEGRVQQLSQNMLLKNLKKFKRTLEKMNKVNKEQKNLEQQEQIIVKKIQQESMKNLIKEIAKRFLKAKKGQPVKIAKKYAASPMGNVDLFHYDSGVLHIVGWAYDPSCISKSSKIVFYDKDEIVASHPFTVIYRGDVAEALKCEEAERGGFMLNSRVITPIELTVVLEYDTEAGKGGMVLGSVPAESGGTSVQEAMIVPLLEKTQIGDIRYFLDNQVAEKKDIPPEIFGHEIDIIVPVYNGMEYFDTLFKGVELTNMQYRLLIVNDKSPDERVLPYLQAYAEKHSNVILLNNEQNLGFVGSVNKALEITKNHVVLLNTDVEVSYQWLERLMIPIICQESVATTTPFTTSGTICSFPNFGEDNPIFEDFDLWQIDEVFSKIKPQYPTIPSGVGFCMGMNKNAIQEIGILDAETFGKGFGEENDWCRRAVEAGYKNVHVDNLFVYHKHCGSFLSEEKERLIQINSKALLKKHPNYNQEVASYCQIDPLRPVRLYAVLKLLNQITDVRSTVAFDHNLGGGASEYLDKKAKELLQNQQKFIIVRYDIQKNKFHTVYRYKNYKVEFFTEKLLLILPLLGRVDEIWINELVSFQNIYGLMDVIQQWKEEQGANLKMLLHDYFAICPAINLIDSSGNYCGGGDVETCSKCIPENKSNACLDYESAQSWRSHWYDFLQSCDEITAFSESTINMLHKAYPELNQVNLVPHEPHYLPKLNKTYKTTETLNIGLLGVLCFKKGLEIVRQMIRVIEENHLNIRICLIGESDEPIDSQVFSQTGRYSREQIPRLTLEQDIDIYFVPSILPETFSYTASEIMSMNMPIVVTDIGAPPERVKQYEKGLVIKTGLNGQEIIAQFQNFAKQVCGIWDMPINTKKVLFIAEENFFASRYRVEHFQEQLLRAGDPSDYIQIEELDKISVRNYKSIVLYRCSKSSELSKIIAEASDYGISVYYDIDDLIFNYDRINYLDFLKDEEYSAFKDVTVKIHQCMEMCDGFLTSTNTLAEEIRKEFPDKPVVIKRNVASMEMETLSMNAWKEAVPDHEKVWIGYFSGSGTHNKDFALVENVLDEVMQQYPQVNLRLGGVIEESKLKKYKDRISKFDFMEWQKLPEAIASVDINLMPLEDTTFHCCKSENKWMEAALVQVPSVMSHNRELEQVVDNYETGILCRNAEEWKVALSRMIEEKDLRIKIGSAANSVVLDRYSTSNTGEDAIQMVTQ